MRALPTGKSEAPLQTAYGRPAHKIREKCEEGTQIRKREKHNPPATHLANEELKGTKSIRNKSPSHLESLASSLVSSTMDIPLVLAITT